jgi:hypothetical protein
VHQPNDVTHPLQDKGTEGVIIEEETPTNNLLIGELSGLHIFYHGALPHNTSPCVCVRVCVHAGVVARVCMLCWGDVCSVVVFFPFLNHRNGR